MATEAVLIRDGANTVAGANYSNSQSLGGPLGSGQYLAVALSSAADRTVLLASAQGQQIFGVLQNKPTSGASADVALFGVTKAVAGGAITRGAPVMVNASGAFVAWIAGSAYAQVGFAIESAVAGQIFTMFLNGTSAKALT